MRNLKKHCLLLGVNEVKIYTLRRNISVESTPYLKMLKNASQLPPVELVQKKKTLGVQSSWHWPFYERSATNLLVDISILHLQYVEIYELSGRVWLRSLRRKFIVCRVNTYMVTFYPLISRPVPTRFQKIPPMTTLLSLQMVVRQRREQWDFLVPA